MDPRPPPYPGLILGIVRLRLPHARPSLGYAGGMESRKTIAIPAYAPQAVLAAAAAVALNPPKGFKKGQVDQINFRVMMSRGVSMASWGENITIQVYTAPDGGSLLEILSTPALPTTLIDYGRGDKNVATLEAAIMSQLGYAVQR